MRSLFRPMPARTRAVPQLRSLSSALARMASALHATVLVASDIDQVVWQDNAKRPARTVPSRI